MHRPDLICTLGHACCEESLTKLSEAAKLLRNVMSSEGQYACAVGSAYLGTINNSIICQPNAPIPAGPAPAPAYAAAGEATLCILNVVHAVFMRPSEEMVPAFLQPDAPEIVRSLPSCMLAASLNHALWTRSCLMPVKRYRPERACLLRRRPECYKRLVRHSAVAHRGHCGADCCADGGGGRVGHPDDQEEATGQTEAGSRPRSPQGARSQHVWSCISIRLVVTGP